MRTTDRPLIIDVIMPRIRQAILAATLLRPDRAWYPADLARHLRSPRSSLQRELKALINAGILKEQRQGRMVYVQANQECPIFVRNEKQVSRRMAGLVGDHAREVDRQYKHARRLVAQRRFIRNT